MITVMGTSPSTTNLHTKAVCQWFAIFYWQLYQLPDPAVDQKVEIVESDGLYPDDHLLAPHLHAGLQELEDVEEDGEEDDGEDVDKQPLLAAPRREGQRAWHQRNPGIKSFNCSFNNTDTLYNIQAEVAKWGQLFREFLL